MSYPADGWLKGYIEFKNGSPLADMDPVEDQGFVLSRGCVFCEDPKAGPYFNTEIDAEGEGRRYQCSECLEPWRVTKEFIRRGLVQVSSRKASVVDWKISKWTDVAIQFEAMQVDLPYTTAIYAHNCIGYSIRDLAAMASETWACDEEAPKSVWLVRKAIIVGRRDWERRLRSIGIRV